MKPLEKSIEKITQFAHPHQDNPEWLLVSLSTAKQRLELLQAEIKEYLLGQTTNLAKEIVALSDDEIADEDFIPMGLPEQKIYVSLDDVLKMLRDL